jgi:hypothetical protein
LPSDTTSISEISGEQLHKLAKGNDLWALVMVLINTQDSSRQEQYLVNGIPPEVQNLIHENNDLFE